MGILKKNEKIILILRLFEELFSSLESCVESIREIERMTTNLFGFISMKSINKLMIAWKALDTEMYILTLNLTTAWTNYFSILSIARWTVLTRFFFLREMFPSKCLIIRNGKLKVVDPFINNPQQLMISTGVGMIA